MNVKALRKLQRYILAEPRRFNMKLWATSDKESSVMINQKPPCNTVGCLAGNAVVMNGTVRIGWDRRSETSFMQSRRTRKRINEWIDRRAQRILRLTERQSKALFFIKGVTGSCIEGWPEPFASQYKAATTLEERAAIASNRIDHFIATKGRE